MTTTEHTCTPTRQPDAPGAALCPNSPRYWRRAENREDGQPYRERTLDEAYGEKR